MLYLEYITTFKLYIDIQSRHVINGRGIQWFTSITYCKLLRSKIKNICIIIPDNGFENVNMIFFIYSSSRKSYQHSDVSSINFTCTQSLKKYFFMVIIVCSRRWMWSVKCYIPMDISHNRGWIISMNVRITFCYLLNVINFIKKSLWGGIRLYISICFCYCFMLVCMSILIHLESWYHGQTEQNKIKYKEQEKQKYYSIAVQFVFVTVRYF